MSDCKTVTHEGKVYQIGGIYEFNDEGTIGDAWEVDELLGASKGKSYTFEARRYEWELIREVNSTIGTITLAPIELIDGNAYMFNYHGKKGISGIYDKDTDRFYYQGGSYIPLDYCTNIRPMTVEKK
jgi:hypothetical protein